jgi:serine/threonine protein kinase
MGAVYAAQRVDRLYDKEVAIKVLRRDQLLREPGRHEELRRRFQFERQALASLDHRNIARLLDGGLTADGLPYLVMDHIEGQPIDEYCRTRGSTTCERLNLFRQVCAAVHCAHQHLVVHRDLKPSNILVAADGTPRLLDFGIAKLLDPLAGPSQTRTHLQPMTPAYASPEQIRGEAVTTASDVYALGVVLYELLTERRPYALEGASQAEAARLICELAPEKPSTAAAGRGPRRSRPGSSGIRWPRGSPGGAETRQTDRLSRRLRGDLDVIVLKALHKEPARRYGSVEQLSEDIRRHLDGLPVLARKDTVFYRASRFVRRHALASAICALLLCGLLAATAAAMLSARAARRARVQAQEEARSANQVAEFLVQLFETADAVERGRRTLPQGHWFLGRFLLAHGRHLLWEGRDGEAEAALLEARDLLEAKLDNGHPLCSECARLLAELHERQDHRP